MKKILLKVLSVSLVIMQIVSFTSFAAIQSESGSSGNYFWYENFASQGLTASGGATVTHNADGSDTVTTSASGKFGYVSLGTVDFTKGPILLSYKIKASAAAKAWGALHIGSPDVDMVVMPKLWDGNKIMGLEKNNASADLAQNTVVGNENGLKETASTSTYKLNTWHIIQVLLDYDSENQILTVNQFADSKPLLKADGTQFSYKLKRASGMGDAMSASMTFRFYVGSGKTAIIDDLMIRQEGNISLDNGAYISNKTATLNIVDDANYDKTFTYQKSVNTTTANDYTLTRYSADDKLLLNGTPVTTKNTENYPGSIVFRSWLEQSATTDFFIFKLTNPDAVKSFSGGTVENPYGLLHSGTTTPVRETHLYDAAGAEVTLDNGKLPSETKKLEFTLSYKVADTIGADGVKIEGDGISAASQKLDNVYTIDLGENNLVTGTEYTITVGDVKKTYITTGEKPAREFAMAECADLDPEKFTNSDSTNVTLTKQSDGLLYTSNRTTGLGNVSYKFNDTFDFTKGAMLVSVDITYNQDMTWIGDVGQLFLPNMYLGSKNIGYITGIQHYGVYGRSADGGRVKVTDAKGKANTVKKGDKVTLRGLFKYKSDEGKIYYTQFADDRRLCLADNNNSIIPAYSVDVTEDVLGQNPVLQFQGRLFKDGGLIINNITVTTVNGITADDVLTFTNGTATAEIKSNVNFAQNAPVSATAPQYTNSAVKSDFTVTKYTSSDKLHLNGTAVTDFTYAAESGKFTIGNLASDGEYVIELSDKTKISDIAENAIDTSIFTTGSAGLLKTTVLNGENKEMTIGADGKIPTNAKKIKFVFTKDYVTSGVSLGGKSASEENGAYTFDFSSDALESNKTYTLAVNGADYGTFTTGDGVFAVNQPSITADGFGSVYIQNTTSADKTVYIIHAGYKADGLLTGVVYEKITAGKGTSETYTMVKKPELTNAQTQKVFVWEDFTTLYPLAEEFSK